MATDLQINAIADIILDEFDMNPASFRASLQVSKAQGDVAQAQAALEKLRSDWLATELVQAGEVDAAVIEIAAAQEALDTFVAADPDLSDPAQEAAWRDLMLAASQKTLALRNLQEAHQLARDDYEATVDLAAQAVTAAQEALASLFEG